MDQPPIIWGLVLKIEHEKWAKYYSAAQTATWTLAENGRELKAGKWHHKEKQPPSCKPELDTTDNWRPEMISRYQ